MIRVANCLIWFSSIDTINPFNANPKSAENTLSGRAALWERVNSNPASD
jgi:hypothetical protein